MKTLSVNENGVIHVKMRPKHRSHTDMNIWNENKTYERYLGRVVFLTENGLNLLCSLALHLVYNVIHIDIILK